MKCFIIGQHLFVMHIYTRYPCYPHMHIVLSLEDLAQRKGYGTRLEAGCSYLVKQRLKLMKVVLVYQCDLVFTIPDVLGQLQAGEPTTQYHYLLVGRL
jgi:hypothetical protein